MAHLDPDALALIALGEQDGGPAERAHLDSCAECRAELAALRRTVAVARDSGEPLQRPAPEVWRSVERELGLSETAVPPAPESPVAPATDAGRPWWRRRAGWVAVAAAFVLGIAGGITVDRLLAAEEPSELVATADLEPLPDSAATEAGTAQVYRTADGYVLAVELADRPGDGFREVWLIDSGVERLISVGVLTGGTGRFQLPGDLDLGEYVIVDVSTEPYDGDPGHSGDSIVRGELRT